MLTTEAHETRGEWLFRQMHALYGARFVAMWRNVDKADLMRGWTHALHGFAPEALHAGIDALRTVPHPPTLPEYLELCRQGRANAAASSPPKLPPPVRADPATVNAAIARMRNIVAPLSKREASPKWAFDLLRCGKAKNGQPLRLEAQRVAADAIVSGVGRAWYASLPASEKTRYRPVFDGAVTSRGGIVPSREPGEDDEEAE